MYSISRRSFLRQVGLAGIGAVAAGTGLTRISAANPVKPLRAVGLQLYSIIHLLKNDFEGTLKTLSDIGYKELEFAGPYYFTPEAEGSEGGFYGNTARDMKALLDRYGLTGPAAHVGLGTLRANLPQVVEAASTIGIDYLVCPFLSGEERQSLDDYKAVAEEFNAIGEKCKKAGIQFAYHNHSFEFAETEGEIPYNVLLESTDPDLVAMEMDLFWIIIAGYDPVEYFKGYPGRFHALHVKDMKKKMVIDNLASFESMKQAFGNLEDVGKGVVDFKRIFSHHDQAGVRHYFVERDRAPNPLETVKNSYAYLSKLAQK